MAVERRTAVDQIPKLIASSPGSTVPVRSHSEQPMHRQPVGKNTALSPVLGVGGKLPPLAVETAGEAHPSRVALQKANGEVGEAMKHLLSEAQSAETRIQKGIDTMWKTMQGMLELQLQQQMAASRRELEEVQARLSRVTTQEDTLVQQNARTSMQLTSEEKKRKELERNVEQLKGKLSQSEKMAEEGKRQLEETNRKRKAEQDNLQAQLDEKTSILREYQAKISKLTEKMNKISKDLSTEKTAAEKLQKNSSGQLSQHVSENRKLALEMSKLKAQLSSSNSALGVSKEEVKRLEQLLKNQQQQLDADLSKKNKAHTATVQELQQKIRCLEEEIERLQRQHQAEIDSLKKMLMEAHVDRESKSEDGLEARIRFLQHQNKQEKIRLQKEISTRQPQ